MPQPTRSRQGVSSLAPLLPNLRWSPERQGVFLVVAPESYPVQVGNSPPPPDGWRPEELARLGRGLLRRFGAVTVLAPAAMRVLKRSFPQGALGTEAEEETALLALLASCSPTQWRKLASSQGLRLRELSGTQRTLAEKLVPPVVRFTLRGSGGAQPTPERTLTDAQRQGIGIRVKLIGGIEGKKLNEKNGVFPLVFHREIGNDPDAKTRIDLEASTLSEEQERAAGITQEVPNRLKSLPGELARLRTPVVLGTEPLTVGHLVERIAQATGVPLLVDARLGKHTVWTRGSQAPAGELLQALCLSTTAAIRTLDALWLLAPDNLPLDVGRIPLEEALLETRQQSSQGEAVLNRRIAALKPLDYLTFDTDDPAALSPALLKKALAVHKSTRSELGAEVRLSELPSALQGRLLQTIEEFARLSDTPEYQKSGLDLKLDSQSVMVGCHPWWSLVIPGVGEANEAPLVPLHHWLPNPPAPPLTLSGRAWLARARTPNDARALVEAARAAGASALWLEAPPEVLAAALEPPSLPVWGVLPVLRGTAGRPDLNVLGDTSAQYARRRGKASELPWLDLQDRSTVESARRALRALGRVSGLAGIVLRHVLPPGYGMLTDPSYGRYAYGAAGDLGYAKENRLAFLREKGVDPADVLSERLYLEGEELNLLVKHDDAWGASWKQWRVERAEALARSLRQELARAAPKLPVLLERAALWQDDGWLYQTCPWFLRWPADKPLPKVERRALGGGAAKRPGWRLLGSDPEANAVLRASTGQSESEVVDLSELRVAEVVKLLEKTAPRGEAPQGAAQERGQP
ncbi:hypothetical protein [Armatimonas rosea]|uniref:Uncharacterized protein n=1 Tax=Armatimonas rosea TaxID=685828 RepID=A0A7W9SVF3_ARMRO|nr:hypothetical protein [Armatimonas rosea]MBB6053065.1 hypothetical protein [Armatimonas rosea]